MPGEVDNLKPRKRKSNTESRSSRKAAAARRRCVKSPKTQSSAESSSVVGNTKAAGPLERLSCIICECHQSAGRRRCSASPEHEGQEGKENALMIGQDLDSCIMNSIWDKPEPEHMDYEETGKIMFPDDDSNQILPVEQFFGNLDAVQDFPERSSASSSRAQRKNRRRHYYAREDSDEEEFSTVRRDDGVGT
uniref:Si:ch211-147a11.3 n=2 Tax=Heroini TaxID=318529 RepID=A0A3Q0SIB3_AMPCI